MRIHLHPIEVSLNFPDFLIGKIVHLEMSVRIGYNNKAFFITNYFPKGLKGHCWLIIIDQIPMNLAHKNLMIRFRYLCKAP